MTAKTGVLCSCAAALVGSPLVHKFILRRLGPRPLRDQQKADWFCSLEGRFSVERDLQRSAHNTVRIALLPA